MASSFSCANGHHWDSDGAGRDACPVCGGAVAAVTDTSPALPETIMQPPGAGPMGEPQETTWKPIDSEPIVFDSDPDVELAPAPVPTVADKDSKLLNLVASIAGHRPSIPGYAILDELGRGGMGVVYKARQVRLKRVVALKMVLSGPHAGSEELERFVTEAEAAARLQHANIVQIYEVGEHEGRPYFSLEYVEGGSLEARLDGKPLPPRPVARLVEALARAMHFAHERHIVHRDLKPANVLLACSREMAAKPPPGKAMGNWLNEVTPKITDFGLAKKLDADAGQTRTGSILGTPNYMSPEQATGQIHAIGPATDIYALGAILYELLTGRPPFQGESAYDTLRRVATAEPLPPRSLVGGMPRDIETICLKCLHKDPRRRYVDALELARDLRRFQDGETIRARPTPAWERAVKWSRRRPGAAALLAAGVVVLLATIAGGLAWHARLKAEAEHEAARSADLQSALEQSRQRLVRLTVANGAHLLEEGDLIGSLPWFAEAMQLERDNPDREAMHRLRLAAVLEQCPRLAQVWFHSGRVNDVAFSADGRQVVSASDDGTARIWDLTTGLPASRTPRHDKPVRRAAFSPDGALVATASADGTAQLWRSDTGTPFGEPMTHPKEVVAVAFSPNGQRLLTACKDGAARLWDVHTLEASVTVHHASPLTQAVFSPDGGQFLTAAEDGSVQVWNAETGLPLARPLRQRGSVLDVAFSQDGRLFVTSCADGSARVWRTDSGLPTTTTLRHAGGVLHASFSPDGRLVATAGADKVARVWSAETGQAVGTPLHHGSKVFAAVFGPSARRLLTISDDNTARVWDASTGQTLGPPLKHNGSVTCGMFSPGGRWVVTAGLDGTVRLWTVTSSQQRAPVLRHGGRVTHVAFSRDGRLVATASADRTARVWDAETGEDISPPLRHPAVVNRIAFSPDGRLLLTGGEDGTARLWNARSGEAVGKPFTHGHAVLDVAFRPDGARFVTACTDGTVRFWEADAGASVLPPLSHDGPVYAAAWSRDGKKLVTASADGTARLWNADTGELLHAFKHAGPVNHATFSPDGSRVATAGADHAARVWDTATGQPVTPPLRHGSPVLHVAFRPDGRRLVTASDDNTARVWSAATGEALTPPLRHMGTVAQALFSPGGELVATVSYDGNARVWDAATDEPITPALHHRGPATAVAFDPRGTQLVTAGPFAARLWRLTRDERQVDELVQTAQLLAVGRIDDTGGLVALDQETIRAAWNEMRRRQREPAPLPEREMADWHHREIEDCEMCGNWHATIWHLDRLLAAHPRDARLLRRRGDARAGLGDWRSAIRDYTLAIAQAPDSWDALLRRGVAHAQLRQWPLAAADFGKNRDVGTDEPHVWHYYALTNLAAGDAAAYRATCADLLQRFSGAADVETARQVVWTALFDPNAVADPKLLVTAAERAAKSRPKGALCLLTLGASLLRAGKPTDAADKLQAALPDSGESVAHTLLFLTLACQQAGRLDDARQWFDRAAEILDEAAQHPEEPSAWDRRLELEILRGEAERLLKQSKP
jgi:WD40 repeat protein/serine/threonine protein kinase/tetratricopeptide (TPR) repeat protein